MKIIQIGCNHCDDDIFKFVKEIENSITKFIVVDALPKCIEIAKEKYSFLGERLVAINCAIGTQTEKINFYFPKGEDTSGHSSISKQHVNRHHHPEVEEISIDCVEVNEFLNKFSFDEIDLFAIDIEGLDVDVLLKLDLDNFHINQIIYEFYHADGTFQVGQKHNELVNKLQNYKYDLKQISEYNILATKI